MLAKGPFYLNGVVFNEGGEFESTLNSLMAWAAAASIGGDWSAQTGEEDVRCRGNLKICRHILWVSYLM